MSTHLTADDLRDLLDSTLTDPALVLDEGRFRVVGAEDVTERNRAFVVLTQEQLRERLPQEEYSRSDLEMQASVLDSTIANLGG
ncbi:hypothetical protein [Rhodococcus sp. CH91]|uniref:hypothetical protein n=1 Tax=Rhodococcus sp. CH91 TaxID=2910256 RepID=UPI001F4B6238|nr:hypothetical protein [Rhodococcus sp. CH91]